MYVQVPVCLFVSFYLCMCVVSFYVCIVSFNVCMCLFMLFSILSGSRHSRGNSSATAVGLATLLE